MAEGLQRLRNIATDIVAKKALEDKLAQTHSSSPYDDFCSQQTADENPLAAEPREADTECDDLTSWRERKLAHLKAQRKDEERLRSTGHGTYSLVTQQEFLEVVTTAKLTVAHFFQEGFETCKVMNMHLDRLAPLHVEARFIRLEAPKCPFFVTKLRIRTLPSVVLFVDGKAVHTIVGFTELGGGITFTTRALEVVLKRYNVIRNLAYPKQSEADVSSEED